MRSSSAFVLAALGCAASAVANTELGHGSFLSVRQPSSGGHAQLAEAFKAKRATSETTSTLATIIQMVIPKCKTTCQPMISDLSSCAAQSSETAIATCACSSTALGDIRTCAACIAQDTTSSKNATAVVNDYNSFVKLCIADGLATVTGTVAVGASTSAIKHTTTIKAKSTKSTTTVSPAALKSNIASVNTTKIKTTKTVKTSSVVLEASSVVIPTAAVAATTSQVPIIASSAVSSASSAAASASATGKTSPAGKVVSSWVAGFLAIAAGAVLAAHA